MIIPYFKLKKESLKRKLSMADYYDPTKQYCTILRKIDTNYANTINYYCYLHDLDYITKTKSRLKADIDFIRNIYPYSPLRALFYGTIVLLFGWIMYYDIDVKFNKAISKILKIMKGIRIVN